MTEQFDGIERIQSGGAAAVLFLCIYFLINDYDIIIKVGFCGVFSEFSVLFQAARTLRFVVHHGGRARSIKGFKAKY